MRVVYRLETIKERLRPVFESYPVYKATLFGSYARGEADDISDLDIVVESRGEIKGLGFCGLIGDISDNLNKRIDLFDITHIKKDSPIYENIVNEGVLLYEKT